MQAEQLLVANPGDVHGDVIERGLADLGAKFIRTSINMLSEQAFTWTPNEGVLEVVLPTGETVAIGSWTTGWFRRPGHFDASAFPTVERSLVEAEARVVFISTLTAAVGRWVDSPESIARAEMKAIQLAAASELGIPFPNTIITGSPEEALLSSRGAAVIAKPVSSGPGLAPFADVVKEDVLSLVATVPTLLQQRVEGDNFRVVTVSDRAFAWRRGSSPDSPVDWRQVDPGGAGFQRSRHPEVEDGALRLALRLGLSFSVQDWIVGDGAWFLEVNPQGAWLFLRGSSESVLPELLKLLRS